MKSKEIPKKPLLEINEEKLEEQLKKLDLNFDSNQKSSSNLEKLDKSKIIDEFFKRQKFFEDNKEQWKYFIQMMASKYRNSKKELERIIKLKINVQALIEFLPKFQISLANYESSLLLNEKHEKYQKVFNQIEFIEKEIDNGASQIYLQKIFNDSVDKFYLETEEYWKKYDDYMLNYTKIVEKLMNFDNKFKETIEMIDKFRVKIKKEKEVEIFKRSEDIINLNIRRKRLNQIIQKPLKVIKMVEIDENGDREPRLEMDTNERLGYTAKSFFLRKNGKLNFYIHLLQNKTGELIQEIMIKEFENGDQPRCKWNNAVEIRELKLVVFTCIHTFGFILEMDENSKKLKENYQKIEIGFSNNWQIIFSEKYAIINNGITKKITVFDSKTLQKIENVKAPNRVFVGEFYDKYNYIYPDYSNQLVNYNVETKKQQIVKGNHPQYQIYSMNISKESNTLFFGHDNGNIYIYKLNLGIRKFASIRKSISTGVTNWICRMEFISTDKLMIANEEKNLRIVDIKSGKIEEKEIIKGNQLGIQDIKFDEKNGVIVVLASDFNGSNLSKSQIHFLSE